MTSITKFVAVSLMSAVVSGCMCMMPMEKMDRGKDNMGQMDMGDKGQSHEMAGTKIEKTKVVRRVGDLMVAFSTIRNLPCQKFVFARYTSLVTAAVSSITVIPGIVIVTSNVTTASLTIPPEASVSFTPTHSRPLSGEWQITVKIQRAGAAEQREHFTVTVT